MVATEKRERGILMSAPMVIADLRGEKTQTRRTRGLDEINKNPGAWRFDGWISEHSDRKNNGKAVWSPVGNDKYCITGSVKVRCPFGVVGDRLWFKETWSGDSVETVYRATHVGPPIGGKWHPSLLMPRVRARTVRVIVAIRVERLQDINEADARAEGAKIEAAEEPYRFAYKCLWESINGPGSWDANPWVWVVEFKRLVNEA